MVSQGCFCDSDGIPGYMKNHEDDDVLGDVISRREVEDFPILVDPGSKHVCVDETADRGRGDLVRDSALGGIQVAVSDSVASSDEDDQLLADDRDVIERRTVNRATKMAFAANQAEREELISLRKKMIEVNQFLRKNGLSMAACEKLIMSEEGVFNSGYYWKG